MGIPGQPYKICPECGQPAELTAQACGRCGHAYRTQFTPAGQPFQTPGAPEQRTQMFGMPPPVPPAPAQPASSQGPLWALAALIARGAFVLLLLLASVQDGQAPSGVGREQQEAASTLTSTGIFRERPSAVEIPTIRIRTDYSGGAILILTGMDGRRYTASCYPNREGVLRVPAGDYGVEVLSPDGSIGASTGTAVFRRFKEYEAEFTLVTYYPWEEPPPLRLGDQ